MKVKVPDVEVLEVWKCWGYHREDACSGRLLHIENKESVLVFTSSASPDRDHKQQPSPALPCK
jgi:hypothetical protein